MSRNNPVATVPTAREQRLEWKPVKGAVFRQLTQFGVLFDVYCLVTGKRYKRAKVDNPKKEADFVCTQCNEGRVCLRIQRSSATGSRWMVKSVKICGCGVPPALLNDLRSNDLTDLVGTNVAPLSDWKLLANACFPYGYSRNTQGSSRRWCISCRRSGCSGEIHTELDWVSGRRYDAFHIVSAIDCSKECKEDGSDGIPISAQSPQDDDETCPLCCQEEPMVEWIQFDCGKRTCRDCFEQLVRTCPSEMQKQKGLFRFEPDKYDSHCHHCPFCKKAYTPRTKLQLHVRGMVDTAEEKEVRELVAIPFAYQSFNNELAAYVATAADYAVVNEQFTEYVHRMEREALEESTAPAEEVWSVLNATALTSFERLATLAQTDLYQRHRHTALNFLEAVEDMHDRGMDHGFLQRVANANGETARCHLIQSAYANGWNEDGVIDPRLVINLLQRKKLLEVIDLVSDDDSHGSVESDESFDESYQNSDSETGST